MKSKWVKQYQRSGSASFPGSTNQFSSPKNSYKFGAYRQHLNGFNFLITSKVNQLARKSFSEFILDLPFYLLIAATTLFVLHTCSEVRPTSTENYDQIAQTVSKQFRAEAMKNPAFAAQFKGIL